MHQQGERRDSKTFVVVDEDCGIPASIVENYRASPDNGATAQSDPRSYLLSMSEFNKQQGYDDVYEYNPTTRSEHGQDYTSFGAQPTFTSQYVGTQAQVPSGLPQSTALSLVPSAQQYSGPHDPIYQAQNDQQYVQHPAYLDTPPRQAPEIINITPRSGYQGTRVTVHFRSIYDLDNPPIRAFLMFGTRRCESQLDKTSYQDGMYQYAITADAPSLSMSNSPSPTPLHLLFDSDLVNWEQSTLEIGDFLYLTAPSYSYPADSPQSTTRKRKLSEQVSPRRSPTKKPSYAQLAAPSRQLTQSYPNTSPAANSASAFRRPSLPDAYSQVRRASTDYHHPYSAPLPVSQQQQYYGPVSAQTTPSLHAVQTPSWAYPHSVQMARSPSGASLSASGRSAHLLPSPGGVSNPPLVRTSTLSQSPSTPATSTASFNPYAIYPSNAKALLKLDGELGHMVNDWSKEEWDVQRRLVQFRRSQTGSVITANFEPVTPETRAPNSICVSCIWWQEKNECYVTSVDTIQLLEALVAVRFTVEEKNRIRRNLEGFRPATVSKAKQDSEEFFKLIMGFPSPKPRNIEKDVKSASYSSTAGALHTPAGSSYTSTISRASDAGFDTSYSHGISPRSSASSSAAAHHAAAVYAPAHTMGNIGYSPHTPSLLGSAAGLGIGPSGAQGSDMRLAVPVPAPGPVALAAATQQAGHGQTTSWHQPVSHYADMSLTATTQQQNRTAWDYNSFMGSSPATGMPGSVPAYNYATQQHATSHLPSLTAQPTMATEARFVPLHDYEQQGQPTSTA
ncbi:hypothetical protein LTS14_005070 [Recurvomyces mirabilis]|nr:hypothetical protein LTS14_005070 [Recurvomyces mirabilis]